MVILIALIVVVPAALLLWQKASGAIVFMAVCLGAVLSKYATADVADAITGFGRTNIAVTDQWVSIALLILPVVLALLFTRGSVKGSRTLFNIIPALATGVLIVLLVTPLLPADIQRQITNQDAYQMLSNLQTAVLLAGAFFGLLQLFVSHSKTHKDEKEKH